MPKEYIINSKKENFIGAWYIDDISICDSLIEYYKENEKYPGVIGTNQETNIVDKTKKDSLDCILDFSCELGKRYLLEQLQSVCEEYIKKFPWCNRFSQWGIIDTVLIQHYSSGGAYHNFHTERCSISFPAVSRHLVFMTYLNNINDCGETEFFHQKIKVKPKKGLTLIWPADWTYTHRGIPSLEEKYVITGWYNFF